MIDYHAHSALSVDSDTPMVDICAAATERGITEIAFAEHMDFIPEEANTGYFDYDAYMRDIAACRSRFAGRLAVRAAIEVDYCPDFEDDIAAWLASKEFDFVVGSVHYIRSRGNISEPRAHEFFGDRPVEEAYADYLRLVLQSARFGLWDALGHLDLIKRYGVETYGPFDPEPFRGIIDDTLRAVIDGGMALEINTSGMRQGPREAYPGSAVLRRYRELGGRLLTVGSDSHDAAHVGAGVPEALRLAQDLGFTHVARYCARRRKNTPIGGLEM